MILNPTDTAKITGHILKIRRQVLFQACITKEKMNGSEYPEKTFGSLLWKYIFKLSIWGSINARAIIFTQK
jgi:hypothetical protein